MMEATAVTPRVIEIQLMSNSLRAKMGPEDKGMLIELPIILGINIPVKHLIFLVAFQPDRAEIASI